MCVFGIEFLIKTFCKMYENAKETIIKLAVVISISCLPFSTTLRGDFVFDDSEAVVKNSDVTSNSLIDPFYKDFWGTNIQSNLSHKSYRPLTIFSFRFVRNFHFLLYYSLQ